MQALKLLELPEPIRDSIDAGRVAPSIGYEIAKVADPGRQIELAEKVARGEVDRAEVRDLTVGAPRPKRWSCTLDGGAQVVVTAPGQEINASSALEKLQAALKRARAEVARSRDGRWRARPIGRAERFESKATRQARAEAKRQAHREASEQRRREREQAVDAYLRRLSPTER
jgi:hypothetical protein